MVVVVVITIVVEMVVVVKNTEIGRNFGAKWSAGTSECDGV